MLEQARGVILFGTMKFVPMQALSFPAIELPGCSSMYPKNTIPDGLLENSQHRSARGFLEPTDRNTTRQAPIQ
jgi:hypothetical protein